MLKTQSQAYKYLLKVLNKYLRDNYKPLPCVYGYIKGKSICENAENHIGKKTVIKADIKDFFYSIIIDMVRKMFINLDAKDNIAEILSKLVTYKGVLYPGLNTSPIISNISLIEMDEDFMKLAEKYNCNYSRYADDITFSGNDFMPERKMIEAILTAYGFQLNKRKYKVMKSGRTQVVTGLSVADATMPRIPRRIKKRIRMACFLCSKLKDYEYDGKVPWCTREHLHGLLVFYEKIEPEFVRKMRRLCRR